ncbi:N-acetylmuramidase domain-containing protein [Sediminimonas qiaohouensis]|uniref:N-acetylmuramidase domain-containing protein n=1 Tax=Sediminimonas qiaohouensis TaxID=552061 RepID=UPI0004174FCA|nr:N-acetylmuramidase domain-containing protein [Sediminimonas qiaohouensis]
MRYPWQGNAQPMSEGKLADAAERIGCGVAEISAVIEVEAAGRAFLRDGTLIRRFEPHTMPGATTSWRDSLGIGPSRRDKMLGEAYERSPDAALRATSWGAPQIMGFNCQAADYDSAAAMVRAFADSEDAQIDGFVSLILDWGLDGAIRAHDWQTFENRYNGGGQGGAYARKIEAAYRRKTGEASPEVLRLGDGGAAVRRLQAALGVTVDGRFGPATEDAVRTFQERVGLPVDGLVGARTWEALKQNRDAKPKVQATKIDKIAARVIEYGTKGGAGAGLGAVLDRAPSGAMDMVFYGLAGVVLIVAAVWALRWARDTV